MSTTSLPWSHNFCSYMYPLCCRQLNTNICTCTGCRRGIKKKSSISTLNYVEKVGECRIYTKKETEKWLHWEAPIRTDNIFAIALCTQAPHAYGCMPILEMSLTFQTSRMLIVNDQHIFQSYRNCIRSSILPAEIYKTCLGQIIWGKKWGSIKKTGKNEGKSARLPHGLLLCALNKI